jgi:colanic acid/amylovoran biosynthesis glycosyltransferase
MGCGLPVVASRISGIPELVSDGESGFLVQPRDAAGIAEALGRLHADPGLRSALGAAGRQTVEQRFDMAANAREVVSAIRDAIDARPQVRP